MSVSATGARRPLQSKPKANPFLKRSSSSAFSNHPRRKTSQSSQPPLKRSKTSHTTSSDDDDSPLDVRGIVTSLPPPRHIPQDVPSLMSYARANMFSSIPERASGMSSTRTAEVLNFRRRLPLIVSVAHVQALSTDPTRTEREIAKRVRDGKIRRIAVLGRGKGGAPVGEGLVEVRDWEDMVRATEELDESLREKYIRVARTNPMSASVLASEFEGEEVSQLVSAGFMTSTSALASGGDLLSRPGAFSLGTSKSVATAGSSAPTGSLAAIGGKGAIHERGGGGGGLQSSNMRKVAKAGGELTFALPMTGAYLRLLTEARAHLIELLTKSSPKYKEASKDMLRERWNGGILSANDEASRQKKARGEWVGVLPGRTKKWKSFYGLDFEWVLAECLGGGQVECFNTGSVGLGVRVV